MCIPYHAIGVMVTDTSSGASVPQPARDVGDDRPVATVTDPDGSVLRLSQDKEVIRNG
jgi:hypothetical protein